MKTIVVLLIVVLTSFTEAQTILPTKTGKRFAYYDVIPNYISGDSSTKPVIDPQHMIIKFYFGKILLNANTQTKLNSINIALRSEGISLQVVNSKTILATFAKPFPSGSDLLYQSRQFPTEIFNALFFKTFGIQSVYAPENKQMHYRGVWAYYKPVKNMKINNGALEESNDSSGPFAEISSDRSAGAINAFLEVLGANKDELSIRIGLNFTAKTIVMNNKSEVIVCYYEDDHLNKIYPDTKYQHGLEFVNKFRSDFVDLDAAFRKFLTPTNIQHIIECR